MNYFSKLAFAILLGSASVGTASKSGKSTSSEDGISTSASKSGKSTTSIDEFDCVEFITGSYWTRTREGAGNPIPAFNAALAPLGTSSCPRSPLGVTFGYEPAFNCADDTIRSLSVVTNGVGGVGEICNTLEALTVSEGFGANAEFVLPDAATRTRLLDECNACDRSTSSKSGKSR